MFDIGFTELLLIAVLGLVVIGPKRLPEVIRSISLWIGRIRRSFSGLKQEMEREFKLDDVRLQLYNEEVMNRLKESKQQVEDAVRESTIEAINPDSGDSVSEQASDSRSDSSPEPSSPLPEDSPLPEKSPLSEEKPPASPSEQPSDQKNQDSDLSSDQTEETRNKQ